METVPLSRPWWESKTIFLRHVDFLTGGRFQPSEAATQRLELRTAGPKRRRLLSSAAATTIKAMNHLSLPLPLSAGEKVKIQATWAGSSLVSLHVLPSAKQSVQKCLSSLALYFGKTRLSAPLKSLVCFHLLFFPDNSFMLGSTILNLFILLSSSSPLKTILGFNQTQRFFYHFFARVLATELPHMGTFFVPALLTPPPFKQTNKHFKLCVYGYLVFYCNNTLPPSLFRTFN